MDSKLDTDEKQLIILTILSCVTVTFGFSNPYVKYLSSYQEYRSPITHITHPAGWNLQLTCAFGKRVQYDNQDHYLTWEFKACGERGSVPCQVAKKNAGILICGVQAKKCRQKLTIPKPKSNDSGLYSCMLHKREKLDYNKVISTYQVEFVEKIKEPPVLLGEEPKNKSVAVSQQVALECQATSYSFPTSIKWLKRIDRDYPNFFKQSTKTITYNNHSYHVILGNLPINTYFIKEAGPLPNGIFMSKLIIKKAEFQHAGSYACLVINTIGIKYREMYLNVLEFTTLREGQRKPPELLEAKSKNVSTIAPQTAMLECQVRSFLPPVVRWLRRIEQISFRTPNLSSVAIQYINNSYQMLTWNDPDKGYYKYYIDETGPEYGDIYTSKLVFPMTSEFDTGFYACIVMNDMGVVHREVFLNVIPTFLSKEEGLARMSMIVLILVPVLLTTIMTVIAFYQKWKNKRLNHHENYERSRVYLESSKRDMFDPVIMCTGNKIC